MKRTSILTRRSGLGVRHPMSLEAIRIRHELWKPEDAKQEIRQVLSVLVVPFINRTCTEEEWRQHIDTTFAQKVPLWRISFGPTAVTEALKSMGLERYDT
jgi:hypothetical protein